MKHVIRKLASTISQPRIQATNYIPGVCNIGPAERARRKQWGIICVVTYILVLTVLIVLHAPRMYRLALIVPAFGALLGFLQDYLHFCVGFGLRGLYNVLRSVGNTDTVDSRKFRAQDRQKALQIISVSLIASIALGIISLLLS
jgi:hypothetical protein